MEKEGTEKRLDKSKEKNRRKSALYITISFYQHHRLKRAKTSIQRR